MPLSHRYRCYGLGIAVDRPLWGSEDKSAPEDVRVERRTLSGSPANPRSWFHYEELPRGGHRLTWTNIARLDVAPDGRTIGYSLYDDRWHATFCHHLLPQALSFVLLRQGVDSLHGCAVEVDGGRRAIAIIGQSGRGKSTLAAYFWRKGHRIHCDDLLAIRFTSSGPMVSAGLAHLKLTGKTLSALGISPAETHRFLEGTSKYIFTMDPPEKPELPLAGIYVLGGGRRVRLATLSSRRSFIELARHPFNAIQNDRRRWRAHFESARGIVASVPVTALSYPRAFDALESVYDRVMAHVTR